MSLEFERAVLRELDQIRDLIGDALREVRIDRERQDEELSELRLQVDRLARMSQPPRKGWARDGGLTVSAATIGALLTALSQWLAPPAPPAPPRAQTHQVP